MVIKWRGFAKQLDSVSRNETTTDEELTYMIASDVWILPPHRFGGANLMDDAIVPPCSPCRCRTVRSRRFKLLSPREGENAKDYGEIYSNN
jgi:hypothetical protein